MHDFKGTIRFPERHLIDILRGIFTEDEYDFVCNYIIASLGSFSEYLSTVFTSYVAPISEDALTDQRYSDVSIYLGNKIPGYNPNYLLIYNLYDEVIYGFDPHVYSSPMEGMYDHFYTDTFSDIVGSFDFGYSADQSQTTMDYIDNITKGLSVFVTTVTSELFHIAVNLIKDSPVCLIYVNTSDTNGSSDFLVFN